MSAYRDQLTMSTDSKPDTSVQKEQINSSSMNTEITLLEVWNSLSSIKTSVSNPDLKLIQKHLQGLEEAFTTFKLRVEQLTTEVKSMRQDNNKLVADVVSLKSKVEELEPGQTILANLNSDVVTEISERMKRANKLFIYNISDSEFETPEATMSIVINMLKVLSLSCPVISARRIGRVGQKPRPVLMVLTSKEDALSVMKMKSKLRSMQYWNTISICHDFTPLQRDHMRQLRSRLLHLHENGYINWTIKYVNGTPSLVAIN